MEILLFLIPLAFILGLASLAGFMWALNAGQFEDLEGHASRILQPDEDEGRASDDHQPTSNKVEP